MNLPPSRSTKAGEHFYQRCIAKEVAAEQEARKRRPGLIHRIFSWMAQPI